MTKTFIGIGVWKSKDGCFLKTLDCGSFTPTYASKEEVAKARFKAMGKTPDLILVMPIE